MTWLGWLFVLSLGGVAAYWLRLALFMLLDDAPELPSLDDSPDHPADSVTTNVVTLSEYRNRKQAS
jgi:hypothetical protein